MGKNKVVFLDRDGTINKDFGYVHETSKLEFLDGVIEGLKKLNFNGYKLIIITNQSGIGRNYYNFQDYENFNNYMLNELSKEGIEICNVYYCPHTEEDNCECRKPKLGLFQQAIYDCDVDLSASFAIGDMTRDLEICNISDIKGILLSKEEKKGYICKSNLLDAANYILDNQ